MKNFIVLILLVFSLMVTPTFVQADDYYIITDRPQYYIDEIIVVHIPYLDHVSTYLPEATYVSIVNSEGIDFP